MTSMFARYFLMLFLAFGIGATAVAQTTTTNSTPQSKESLSDSAAWRGYLQSAEQALARESLTENQFETFDINAAKIITNATELISNLTPEHTQLTQRLTDLGAAPKEGEAGETDEIVKLRETLNSDFSAIDGQIKDARQIIIRVNQFKSNALAKRRAGFVNAMATKSHSVLEITFWSEFAQGFSGFGKSFRLLIKDSFAVISKRLVALCWQAFPVGFGLLLGALVYLIVRRKTRKYLPEDEQATHLDRKQTIQWAIAEFARSGVLKTAFLFYLYGLFTGFDLLPDRFEKFIWAAFLALGAVLITYSLAKVFLAPTNNRARIANISDQPAQRIMRTIIVVVSIIAFFDTLNFTSVLLLSPFEISIGLSAMLAIIGVLGIVRVMLIASHDRRNSPAPIFQAARILRWVYLRPVLWIGILITLACLVFGYIAFAEFVILQLVAGSIVLAILWLILELIDTNRQSVSETQAPAQYMSGNQSSKMRQFSILGFGIVKILAILTAVFALSLPWGYRTSDWLQWLNGAFFGFQIGGLTVSFSTILLGFGLFFIGYVVTRMLQSWLKDQFLPATNIESGLRNSLSTVLGYAGFVLAAMVAISAAGLDLSNLAIVAGALSVGIGFGLQSIINNFVSGLILLAERPIKVGDWIITTGGEGTVRKISVRSTEIQTFDRATVVVPNSILITDPITNWTHTSKLGRIKIAIGVGYDSDPDQVRDLLLACMNEHEGVLKDPSPSVFFLDFGDNALLFEVRGVLSNIEDGLGIRSEIRFAILRAMRAAKIEIPYPQRDVHIKTEAPAKPARRPAARKRTSRTTKAK